jgi:hypothetical protein
MCIISSCFGGMGGGQRGSSTGFGVHCILRRRSSEAFCCSSVTLTLWTSANVLMRPLNVIFIYILFFGVQFLGILSRLEHGPDPATEECNLLCRFKLVLINRIALNDLCFLYMHL